MKEDSTFGQRIYHGFCLLLLLQQPQSSAGQTKFQNAVFLFIENSIYWFWL